MKRFRWKLLSIWNLTSLEYERASTYRGDDFCAIAAGIGHAPRPADVHRAPMVVQQHDRLPDLSTRNVMVVFFRESLRRPRKEGTFRLIPPEERFLVEWGGEYLERDMVGSMPPKFFRQTRALQIRNRPAGLPNPCAPYLRGVFHGQRIRFRPGRRRQSGKPGFQNEKGFISRPCPTFISVAPFLT